jgi:hypothetical protein
LEPGGPYSGVSRRLQGRSSGCRAVGSGRSPRRGGNQPATQPPCIPRAGCRSGRICLGGPGIRWWARRIHVLPVEIGMPTGWSMAARLFDTW